MDGVVPNNSLPLVVYRGALGEAGDRAKACVALFNKNGWPNPWRNGIYGHHHYHSTAHEVLGIAAGSARVRLGGEKGETVELYAGRCGRHSGRGRAQARGGERRFAGDRVLSERPEPGHLPRRSRAARPGRGECRGRAATRERPGLWWCRAAARSVRRRQRDAAAGIDDVAAIAERPVRPRARSGARSTT